MLIVAVNAMWMGMDWWLHSHGHEYLTVEFQEAIGTPWGPFLAGGVAFTVVAFITHMAWAKG